jgi:Protein of unknown function (DUF3987)
MIQRFQVLVYPDIPPHWEYIDRPPNAAAQQQVQTIFDAILKLEPQEPVLFRFSPEAQDVFVKWLERLEIRIRNDGLDPSLAGHLSKFRGLMPSLGLIFQIAEEAEKGFVGSVGAKVGSPHNGCSVSGRPRITCQSSLFSVFPRSPQCSDAGREDQTKHGWREWLLYMPRRLPEGLESFENTGRR